MGEWVDFGLHWEGSGIFAALIPLTCLAAYALYRLTQPPVGRGQRLLLIALRSAAVGLLLLILAEPVLSLWRKQVVHPLFLLLVDTSPSMAIEEGEGQRLQQVQEVLAEAEWRKVLAVARVQAWGFAGSPYALDLDTLSALRPRGRATDLARALKEGLEQVREREDLRGILLLSDGAHNLGGDPVRAAAEGGVPVYALAVGSRADPPDIQIARAKVPEIGYVGRSAEVEAQVRAWGYEGREVEVRLFENQEQIGQQRLVLAGGGLEQRLAFAVQPRLPGPHLYRLSVLPLPGEISRDNNEVLLLTQVRERQAKVLLVAGGPSPDLAFLQRTLQADSSLSVVSWVQKERGSFYQGRELPWEVMEAQDAIVLLDPGPELSGGRMGELVQKRVQAGAGLLFLGGPRTREVWNAGYPLAELLPGWPGERFIAQEIGLRLVPEGRRHPVVRRFGEAMAREEDPWMALPPLPGYFPVVRLKEGSVPLVEGASGSRPPIFVAGTYGLGKVIAGLSTSFWRLELMSSGVGGQPQTIKQFWQNAVKWLALEAPSGRVRVSTERQVYRAGEEVVFAAQVFDELLRPQEGAVVRITLGQKDWEFPLSEQGGGQYRGRWSGLEPGDYTYRAEVWVGGESIGREEGRFIVEPHAVESVDVRANPTLLGEMAQASGGRMRPLREWRELLQGLPLQPRLAEQEKTLRLWGENWPLVWVISMLALEWGLRRRWGLI